MCAMANQKVKFWGKYPEYLPKNIDRLGKYVLKQLEKKYEENNENSFFIRVARFRNETINAFLEIPYGLYYDHDSRRNGYNFTLTENGKYIYIEYH
jgi:hypothetical protein